MIHINRNPPTEKPKKQNNTKKRWHSPTSINAYLRCPRKYYYGKIRKLKQKPSIHLIRGIAVHSAVGKFYKHKLNRCANMAYSDLQQIVNELLKDEWFSQKKSLLELKLNDDEMAFYFQDSQKMMINFLHDFIRDRGFEKPAPTLEKMLFSKKNMLLGRIDAIHNSRDPPLIVDFKTCKSKEISDDYKRQLGIYALLFQENYKTLPDVGIHFLKFQNGLKTFRVNNKYMDNIRNLVLDIHAKTQSENIEDYPCICGWCGKNFETKSQPKSEAKA